MNTSVHDDLDEHARYAPCKCQRGVYDRTQYSSCYECFLERGGSGRIRCILCGSWHSPRYVVCFTCRRILGREEAGKTLKLDILMRDNFTCRYCGQRDGVFIIDHIKPCAEGGKAVPWNLQVLCRACGQSKGTTWYRGSQHYHALIFLMHCYLTFWWDFLDEDERTMLLTDAAVYGDEFKFQPRFRSLNSHAASPGPTMLPRLITAMPAGQHRTMKGLM